MFGGKWEYNISVSHVSNEYFIIYKIQSDVKFLNLKDLVKVHEEP